MDEDMLHLWRHCTNLQGLSLKETEVTDILLAAVMESMTTSSGSRLPLIHLNVADTDISDNCLESVIRTSRDTLTSLTAYSNHFYGIDCETLHALVEDSRKVRVQSGHLSGLSGGFFENVFEELFQYATELSTIRLESCEFLEGALLVLAENYRGKVVGGLKVLWLKDCSEIGIRAIVRFCVGLERLGLSGDSRVSLRIFRGPWACLDLVELDISEVNVGFRGPGGMMDMNEEVGEDEYAEARRFPIAPLKDFNTRLDFGSDGNYDYISRPSGEVVFEHDDEGIREESLWEKDLIEDGYFFNNMYDDDHYDSDFSNGDEGGKHDIPKSPPSGLRNQIAHRTTLQEFYKRQGQLKHLRKLNMSNSDYRIRIHDGLYLVLPGLRNSLEEWNMTRYLEYRLHHDELAWIGKHFGYGFRFPNSEEGLEYQGMMIAKFNADGNPDKHRIGRLKLLTVSKYAIAGCLTADVDEWLGDQGITVCYQDEDDKVGSVEPTGEQGAEE
ncbi:MAG: hypothetical protein J3Q66DRAFT_421332 [Benniella sp.]|nr:MAG: hypothetical protein J3Q66DRAFT_421332 [Benniella sp.]